MKDFLPQGGNSVVVPLENANDPLEPMSPGQISHKRPDALPPKASEEMAVSARPGWGRFVEAAN